jgi:hypothetical protein
MWVLLAGIAMAAPTAPEVQTALAHRHSPPTCRDLADQGVPTNLLVELAAGDIQPPWVSMRAAACVAARADEPEADAAIRAWIADPALPGLALVVAWSMDAMPEAAAAELAPLVVGRCDREARFARLARPSLEAASSPAVIRALTPEH